MSTIDSITIGAILVVVILIGGFLKLGNTWKDLNFMENKLLWVFTLAVLFFTGLGIYRKAFAAGHPGGNYCQFQVNPGHPSQTGQCFMDEVMTGFDGQYIYCSRPSVFCYRREVEKQD